MNLSQKLNIQKILRKKHYLALKKTGKIKLVEKYICDHQGYGKANPKPGSHLVIPSDKEVCTTMTTFVGLNKCVVEVYEEEDTENSDSE